jgi:hypothetical protein
MFLLLQFEANKLLGNPLIEMNDGAWLCVIPQHSDMKGLTQNISLLSNDQDESP